MHRRQAPSTKAAPGTKETLTLADHSLSSDMHPIITLSYDPLNLRELRFTLWFDGLVKWVMLIIADGKITSVEGADLTRRPRSIIKSTSSAGFWSRNLPSPRRIFRERRHNDPV